MNRFLRSGFICAAFSSGIITVAIPIKYLDWNRDSIATNVAFIYGSLASTLFFLGGATWRFKGGVTQVGGTQVKKENTNKNPFFYNGPHSKSNS